MGSQVDWWGTLREVIDMRSFSSIWYWMAVAVVWSSASHFVMGVPYDMVVRARRRGGEAARDLRDLARINANRLLQFDEAGGAAFLGLLAFVLSTLAILGFWYGIEFAQAVLLIAGPLVPVGMLTVRLARRVAREGLEGEALCRRIGITRFWIQLTGLVALCLTAGWGVYVNLIVRIPFD